MNRPYRVIRTQKLDLTSSFTSIDTSEADGHVIRLFADRPFHFEVGNMATTENTPVAADTAEFISGFAKDTEFTAILAEGETDGSIWVSYIQFS